jgi:hypothetical protein
VASAGARACVAMWGLCPQWGPGAKPMVRGQRGKAPLKLFGAFCTSFSVFGLLNLYKEKPKFIIHFIIIVWQTGDVFFTRSP